MASRKLKDITETRVELCRVALLRDADTSCIFSGRFTLDGNEIALALGDNGHVVLCDIFTNNEVYIGPVQRHTTLLHLLCQFRLQLLLFLCKQSLQKPGKLSNIPQLIIQQLFGEVLEVILTSFQGLHRILDHAETTPLSRLIQSISKCNCLLNWEPVFERLVNVHMEEEPSAVDEFIRSVIDKLCLVNFPTRDCNSDCTCEQKIFTTLLKIHPDSNTFVFPSAAEHGNFHLMDMFLKLHDSNLSPYFITPHVVSDRGALNSSEPLIVYFLKTAVCRRLSESQLVYLLEMLANVSTIDINEPDADGLNALFYAANFKLKRPFYLLLNHNKFKGDWRNRDGESLEELFCWSRLDQINPAALIALRRKTGSRIGTQSTWTLDSQLEMEIFEKTIQRNFRLLCRDMEPDGPLLDALVEHGVVTFTKMDQIASQKTRQEKVHTVLNLVIRSGKKGRLAFHDGLRYSRQQHLLDALTSTSLQSLSLRTLDISRQQNSSVEDNTSELATNLCLPVQEEMNIELN